MAWSAPTDPVDFKEALAWFRKRVPLTKDQWSKLRGEARARAFTVANVSKLDLVHQAWAAVESAIANGTSLESFKKDIGEALQKAWSGKVDDPPWRLETIFRTNVQNAYATGRFEQASHPDVLADRPVWMFDAILDGRQTEVCSACDGTKRPADDPWWNTHVPPLHFNCRSSFVALSEKQAGKLTKAPTASADDGFGKTPSLSGWEPDLSKYPPELRKAYEDKIK